VNPCCVALCDTAGISIFLAIISKNIYAYLQHQTVNMSQNKNFNLLTTMVIAWLIAGTLDGLAALFILAKGNVVVFKYVASAVFGPTAFDGGTNMVLAGVAFHYVVALGVTAFYFIIYKYLPDIKTNKPLMVALYGLFVWVVMNLVVVKLTNAHPSPMTVQGAVKNSVILIFCIALPIVLMRDYYRRQSLINR
jgi:hypothetical protein